MPAAKPRGKAKQAKAPAKRKRAGIGRQKAADAPLPDEHLQPWEQQPDETAPAFQAFARYRDQEPADRSLRAVARSLGKSGSLVSKWSARHDWQHRVAAWDLEADRLATIELQQDRVDAARRHAQTAQGQIQVAATFAGEVLRRALEEGQGDQAWIRKLDNDTLLRFALQAARATPRLIVAERLSLGISTENIGGHDGGPLGPGAEQIAGKTDDELDAIINGQGNVTSIDTKRKGRP